MKHPPHASATPLSAHPSSNASAESMQHEQEVLRAIRDTAFGTVEVVVHQSRIVQITRSEKQRFEGG